MAGYDMKAFHDTKAAPVKVISVSSSHSIAEYLPKLAEEAGLGQKLPYVSGTGIHKYENGEIHVEKESR